MKNEDLLPIVWILYGFCAVCAVSLTILIVGEIFSCISKLMG